MTKRIYIYRIYFPASNKCYIGQTIDLQRRMKQHFESGHLICKALWKYNNYQVSILHTCKSHDVANVLEIEDIRNFNSVRPNGYNLTHGGGSEIPCQETKEKMRQAQLGKKSSAETKEKLRLAHLGIKHSEERREKNRLAHLGHKHSEETKLKMRRAASGKKFSEESKEKMRLAQLGNQNALGAKHSEEAKEKTRLANLGRKHSEKAKLNMRLARLKRMSKELEQELITACPWDGT